MVKRAIVGATRLPGGEIVCAATTRRVNSLWQGDGRSWRLLAEWKGKEVTACCASGAAVVCPALDGKLYVFAEGEVRTLSLPDPEAWIAEGRALEDGRVLMGGARGLVFYDPASGAVTAKRLSHYGIDKPGRRIHGVSQAEGRVFIVGARNLVLEYDERTDTLVERANMATFGGRELLFTSALPSGERLWLGGMGVLAAVDEEQAQVWEDPLGDRNHQVGVRWFRDELMVYQSELWVGEPGAWRPLVDGFQAESILSVEDSPVEGELVAVSYTGQAYVLADGSAQPLPVFEA